MKVFYNLFSFLFFVSASFGQQLPNIDPSFGNNGIAAAEFANSFDEAFSSLILPDGRILIAGRTDLGSGNGKPIVLAMFTSNGQPDNNFGTAGKKIISTGPNNVVNLRTPLLQPDGKIVLPGNLNVNNITRRMVARILPNGELDASFGENGFYISNNPLGAVGEDVVECFLLPTGEIWGVGMTGVSVPPDGNFRSRYSSFRLTTDGIIDTAYTKTSTFKLHAGTTGLGNDIAYAACRTPDNGIMLVGITSTNPGHTLLKLTLEGKPDSTFGRNGFTRQNPIYSTIFPRRIIPAQDGGYLLCANARLSGTGQPDNTALYKFSNAGLYDSTFGTNGIALTPYEGVPPTNPWAVDAVQDANGKIWVAHYGQFVGGGPRVFSVSRFTPNGSIDNTYGTSGIVATLLSGNPRRIHLGADGLPLLTGDGTYSGYTSDKDLVAIKVNPNPVAIKHKTNFKLSVYPNLVKQGEYVSAALPFNGETNVSLIDAKGQLFKFDYQAIGNLINIDTKTLAAGIYQIVVQQNQQQLRGRLCIQ